MNSLVVANCDHLKNLKYSIHPERKIEKHDEEIYTIFQAIKQLMATPEKNRRKTSIAQA